MLSSAKAGLRPDSKAMLATPPASFRKSRRNMKISLFYGFDGAGQDRKYIWFA
jgi:hypothetical protein